MDKYTIESGRTIARDGVPLFFLQRVGSDSAGYALDPVDASTYAEHCVALLNANPPPWMPVHAWVFDFAGWYFYTQAETANGARENLARSIYGGQVYNVGPLRVDCTVDEYAERVAYEVREDEGGDTDHEMVGPAFAADDWSGYAYQGSVRRVDGEWIAFVYYNGEPKSADTFAHHADAVERAKEAAESAADQDRDEQAAGDSSAEACEHDEGDPCMICTVCGKCKESLDCTDTCTECGGHDCETKHPGTDVEVNA